MRLSNINLPKLIGGLYALIIVCIGAATIIEKYRGTSFVSDHIYGSWWFVVLWTALTVAACIYMCQQRLYRRLGVMLLHASFVVILAGALTTWLTARRGTVNLRIGQTTASYTDAKGAGQQLPFRLQLKEFRIVNYPGTDVPLDYQSVISATGGTDADSEFVVSMNHIGNVGGYRLFQSGYDSDGQGVALGVCFDPYGIAITYCGYLLLLVGIVATLLSRKTQMRALYRIVARPIAVALLLMATATGSHAAELQTVDRDIATRLGTVNVLYNNRICPLNTVATDFVTKLSGSASWGGYTADEIFASWMIYYSPWEQQKIIRIKDKPVRRLLGISGQWASYSDFWDEYHEYKLKVALEEVRTGKNTQNRKALMTADEKFHVVDMFYRGQMLRMFPYDIKGQVSWYTPGAQALPREIPVKEQFFIKQAMDYLTESIVTGQRERAFELIAKIKLFQRDMIGDMLPSEQMTQTELVYNRLSTPKWPVFLTLTLSLLISLIVMSSATVASRRWFRLASTTFVSLLAVWLTVLLVMRWIVSGHIPISNGYETMQFMAWAVLAITIALHRKAAVMMGFGPLVAAFCLLVAMLASGSPQITPLMPVLASPLLSVHVMTVMCAYALFALQLLLGVQGMLLLRRGRTAELQRTTALSQLLLYPAVFLLVIGIFLGAVWANVSWGSYWSWDPKESWALITFMVYSVPLHRASIRSFDRPLFYHAYMVGAFLTVMATYFGVNYLLGGMHSYA
ncbi:MAG: cytochrome c biogenesis protein CcsA [Prevotella sp.]|nr:cytochrome c biogenesis protein CcsA [Prevotella sp.]